MTNGKTASKKPSCDVLLIDDNRGFRDLLKTYLTDPKITLTLSNSGEEGIEAFKSKTFDLVLMDMQMPGMDGYEAARAIRLWENDNDLPPTPIAALTARESTEDVSEMFEAGCTHYLRKPITRQILLQTVAQYSRRN